MWKAERGLANRPGVASPPPATWSVTVCLSYRGGLEIRTAPENVLPRPRRGHGGKRISFLLRLRRRLGLAVTSKCGHALAPAEHDKKPPAEPDKKPRGLKLLRFLRSRLARAPRLTSLLRRKKAPLPPAPRAAVAMKGPRTPAIPSLLMNFVPMRPATTTALCFLAGFAVSMAFVGALRLMAGFMIENTSCTSWRSFLAEEFVTFLGPPLFDCLSNISLKLVKFLDPPEWLGLAKLSLKWLFSK